MPIETVTGIQDLNPSWPTGVDPVSEGDDHDRLTKSAIQQSFPNMTGPWLTSSQIQANGFNANNNRVVNVATPVDPTDAVRKGDTDALDARLAVLEAQLALFSSFGNITYTGPGTPVIQGGSGDFSIAHVSTGVLDITFTEAAAQLWSQSLLAGTLATGIFADNYAITVWPQSTTVWRVTTFASNGAEADLPITFQRVAN